MPRTVRRNDRAWTAGGLRWQPPLTSVVTEHPSNVPGARPGRAEAEGQATHGSKQCVHLCACVCTRVSACVCLCVCAAATVS